MRIPFPAAFPICDLLTFAIPLLRFNSNCWPKAEYCGFIQSLLQIESEKRIKTGARRSANDLHCRGQYFRSINRVQVRIYWNIKWFLNWIVLCTVLVDELLRHPTLASVLLRMYFGKGLFEHPTNIICAYLMCLHCVICIMLIIL